MGLAVVADISKLQLDFQFMQVPGSKQLDFFLPKNAIFSIPIQPLSGTPITDHQPPVKLGLVFILRRVIVPVDMFCQYF